MAQEIYYNCPRCDERVHAVAPLSGAICLQCNGVQHWQPVLIQIANSVRMESNKQNALSLAIGLLQSVGIYQDFMRLYGAQLMRSLNINMRSQQSHNKAHNNDNVTEK